MTDLLTICMYTGIITWIALVSSTIVWLFRCVSDNILTKYNLKEKIHWRGFKLGATKREESS